MAERCRSAQKCLRQQRPDDGRGHEDVAYAAAARKYQPARFRGRAY